MEEADDHGDDAHGDPGAEADADADADADAAAADDDEDDDDDALKVAAKVL